MYNPLFLKYTTYNTTLCFYFIQVSFSLFNSPVAKLVLNAKLPSFLKIETFLNGQTVNYIQLVKQRVFFRFSVMKHSEYHRDHRAIYWKVGWSHFASFPIWVLSKELLALRWLNVFRHKTLVSQCLWTLVRNHSCLPSWSLVKLFFI